MAGIAWFARNELRRRWRSVLGLAVLVAVAGGVVLATAAGARRTSDVTDRFLAVTRARDASVQIDEDDPMPILDAIEELRIVEGSGRLDILPVLPDPEDIETEIDLALHGSPDGRWAVDIDRPLVVSGRAPYTSRPEEVMLNEVAAVQADLAVGDRFSVTTFTPAELVSVLSGGEYTGFNGPRVDLEVVGIGRQGSDLQGADTTAGGVILVTPALMDRLEGRAGALSGVMAVDLAPGATIDDLRQGVRAVLDDDGAAWDVGSAEADFASSTRDATDVLARSLWLFAAIAAVASAVAVGGTMSRQNAQARAVLPVLRALGCPRRERIAAIAAVPLTGLLLGSVGALLVAVGLSPTFPISVARRVEPDPGFRLDPLVLGGGFAILVLGGAAWMWAAARVVPGARGRWRARRWRATGLPPAGAIGLSHAFDPGADDRTVPVRAALAAATAGVLGVVMASTIVHSLDELIEDPRRYGWAWSAEPDVYTDQPEEVLTGMIAHDGVSTVSLRSVGRVELGGVVSEGVAYDDRKGSIEPSIRSGRAPADQTEVAIGQHTADELGVGLGDTVRANRSEGSGTVPFEVVGISVVAAVDSTDPAVGVVMTPEALESVRQSDGFTSMLVSYAEGADVRAVERSLARELSIDFSVYSRPILPGGVENLRRAMPIVVGLAGFSAALGLIGVGHGLVVGTRRRRRELSTLRALGMRAGQVGRIVAVQALATMTFALVVGIPVGLAAGRIVWRLVIDGQGLIDEPATPVVALAVLVPAALVLAGALSWWPGRTAGRAPAQALRSE